MAKIDKKYHKLLRKILKEGFTYEDPNRKGVNRIQIPSYTFKHDFKDGFPAVTTKRLYWKAVVGELLWFLRGDTNIKYLVDNGINIWNKDAYNYYVSKGEGKFGIKSYEEFIKNIDIQRNISNSKNHTFGGLGRVYGAQWRDWNKPYEINGLDQISNLIKGLKENPMGTRHIVTAWNPAELSNMALPPCHWSFEILVEPYYHNKRYNESSNQGVKLPEYQFTLKWHQRSVDTFLGLPFNIASYSLLAPIIGMMTNMVPKGIIGDLSNVHIYEPHLDAVKKQLANDPNKHGKAELNVDMMNRIDTSKSIDHIFNMAQISDFELLNYTSYGWIAAEMLAYNK